MAQFAVYGNRDARSKDEFPLLVDVQSDLFDALVTRVVIPLSNARSLKKRPLDRLTPIVEVQGEHYVLLTPQLAGVATSELGPAVADVSLQRDVIIGALDMLITGV